MSKLYELADSFEELYDAFDDFDPTDENYPDLCTAWFDTLDGLEGEFLQKAESVAVFAKRLAYEADMLKAEEKAIAARRKAAERKAESIKGYLKDCMDKLNTTRIDGTKARVSIRTNAESVLVVDATKILYPSSPWLKPVQLTEDDISKTAVKEALQRGEEIPGCELIRTRSIIIK